MAYSFLSHLECPKCGTHYDADTIQQICSCGAPLLARYDLEALAKSYNRDEVARRASSLWRYHELLPVRSKENVVSLGETITPILALRNLGAHIDVPGLALKDEGLLPTGSFKARGAAVGVSRAKELGVRSLGMPTNGNAGAAWAAYATRAGIDSYIVMPGSAPRMPRVECSIVGAHTYLVDGLISDAGSIVAGAIREHGMFDASTLKEPYRIEGKKTMGLEIIEQYDYDLPDVIVYPTGGGVGLIGIYKAVQELRALGLVDRMPRFVAVQAEGCAPIVRAFEQHAAASEFWADAQTVAFGITVPKALGDFLVLEALYESDGTAIAVPDEAILRWQAELARREGLFICPEGAATVAATAMLREQGWIGRSDRVVVLNTGTGLKYTDGLQPELPELAKGARLPL